MSIKWMDTVLDFSPYDGKALMVHLMLAYFANDEGFCWPSQPTLAYKARCTERYVRDIIATMQEDGWIEIVEYSTQHMSHRYRLLRGHKVRAELSSPLTTSAEVCDTDSREELSDTQRGNPLPEIRQEPSLRRTPAGVGLRSDLEAAPTVSPQQAAIRIIKSIVVPMQQKGTYTQVTDWLVKDLTAFIADYKGTTDEVEQAVRKLAESNVRIGDRSLLAATSGLELVSADPKQKGAYRNGGYYNAKGTFTLAADMPHDWSQYPDGEVAF